MGSLNIGYRALISLHGKPINRLFQRSRHTVTISAGKVPQNLYKDLTTPLCQRRSHALCLHLALGALLRLHIISNYSCCTISVVAIKMSRLTTNEALEMLILDGFDELDSRGELDIDEEPDFPLPHYSDSDISDDERAPHDLGPSSSTVHHPSPSNSDQGTDFDENLFVDGGKQI